MEIKFSEIKAPRKGSVAILVGEDLKLTKFATDLDKKSSSLIKKLIKSDNFKGKKGKIVDTALPGSSAADNLIIIGTGNKKDKLQELDIQKLGGQIYATANSLKSKEVTVIIESKIENLSAVDVAANIAYGANLRSYNFNKYFVDKKDEHKDYCKIFNVAVKEQVKARKAFTRLSAIADGVFFARDLVSEPPNVIYPDSYAEACVSLSKYGVKIEILNKQQMQRLGMGALLGVAQGSVNEPKLAIMKWQGKGDFRKNRPIAFVGKGVTFDSGGLSLKPSNGMEEMKYDMAGSAAVAGVITALAKRKAKVNAVGVIGLVENMPSGSAQRPSDIVTSMSGQTIEVLNTDAEGRLVLADALWYTQDKFKPKYMINLATLTGAIVVALGKHYAGMFTNNKKLSEMLVKSGERTGEKLWALPMDEAYDKQIDSMAADVQNIGNESGAGSITAAKFLERFVNKTPWAHLDIAGVAWTKKDVDLAQKGANGFGVRLLDDFVARNFE